MSIKLKPWVMGAGLALAALSTPTMAVTWFLPTTSFEDNNIDRVFDNNSNGLIDLGDRLVAVAEFETTSGNFSGQGPDPTVQEITAVSDVTIVGVLGSGTLILAPTGAGGLLGGFAAGTMVALFSDTTPDLNVVNAACGGLASCTSLAGLGLIDGSTVFMTAGFFGDADASWTSTPAAGGTSIATVKGGNANAKFGAFNFALDIDINNTGISFAEQSCAPFCAPGGDGKIKLVGSGDILGGVGLTAASGWTARSDSDFGVVPIPEPASLGLMGAGLVAFGFRRRAQQ